MIQRLVNRAFSRFRRKPRQGLRGSRRTKQVLRWAIAHNSVAIYVLVQVWPLVILAILATGTILWSNVPSAVTPWLYYAKVSLVAVLAWIYVIDAVIRPFTSWRKRHAKKQA